MKGRLQASLEVLLKTSDNSGVDALGYRCQCSRITDLGEDGPDGFMPPEDFRRLREEYEQALGYCKRKHQGHRITTSVESSDCELRIDRCRGQCRLYVQCHRLDPQGNEKPVGQKYFMKVPCKRLGRK